MARAITSKVVTDKAPRKPAAAAATEAKAKAPKAKAAAPKAKASAPKASTAASKATTPAPKAKKTKAAATAGYALPEAMTGRASPAKAADGDAPVFAYIRSLPQPQRAIAERIDALAAEALPGLQRAVKWGIAWYGVGDGFCFCCGGFAGHVKLTFGRGTSLDPVPPSTPIGMGKDSRGVEIASLGELDEGQAAAWMKQATGMPGFGKRKG